MRRRTFLVSVAGVFPALAGCVTKAGDSADAPLNRTFEVSRSAADWRRRLSPEQYRVLREHETERPGSSPLNDEHRAGVYRCAGCALPLFPSEAKFESGTGWPSFTHPLPNAIGTSVDRSLLMIRTEVHCRRCGGHLGHVFADGPPPTGSRYCLNGVALTFTLQESE
jgi:peptide-methionine (R)-S-oxide reductase